LTALIRGTYAQMVFLRESAERMKGPGSCLR
jgi:hypothetical protein